MRVKAMNQNVCVLKSRVTLATSVLAFASSNSLGVHPTPAQAGQTNNNLPDQPVFANEYSKEQATNDDKERNDDKEGADDQLLKAVSNSVLEDLSKQTGVPISDLRIFRVERKTWSDACLGLAKPGDSCTQVVVPGWLITVTNTKQSWVYRANASGSTVALDEVATRSLTARSSRQTTIEQAVTAQEFSRIAQITTSGEQASANTERPQTATGREQLYAKTQSTGQTDMATQVSFQDVSSTYWASSFITELVKLGIVEGFPDGKFRPEAPVSRAQFAAMLRKAFEKTKVNNAIAFKDVPENHWGYTAIQETYEMGFMGVDADNRFRPALSMSRLNILEALATGLNYSDTSNSDNVLQFYSDAASIPSNVRGLVAAMTQRGVIVNYPNVKRLHLKKLATRADACALVYQALVSTGRLSTINSPYVVKYKVEQ